MSKSKNNESKLAPKYRIQNHAWINVLREKRHKDGRDFKIIITSRNSTTGTGKTTLALWLALNWDSDFTADQATLHVNEYLDIYKEQSKGSVLIMDEAEQVDARRSMSNQNVEFSEKWSMMRYSEVDSILTLPTVTALDKRVEELADVWINVIERGYANCHLVTVHDFEKTVETPPWHSLSWPDISHLSVAKELEQKKEQKIAGEIYGNDTAEEKKQEEFENKYELRLAQRLRDNGKTLREIAEDDDIDHSYSWVYENTSPPEE